ncbi:BspA family leucine-rich repeat surface protein [Enterococcus faecium]|uniref:BspA family leucine-rich repeat surface protein n=1 Tax=Enterococcus faecium TaxID=1352 RepID=UPI00300BC15B
MNSRKYKYIILSSAILGSLGFASLTTYSDTVDSNQQQVLEKKEDSTQVTTEDNVNILSKEQNIENNSKSLLNNTDSVLNKNQSRSIDIGKTVEFEKNLVIGEWSVKKYRYYTNNSSYKPYYQLERYQGSSQDIQIPTSLSENGIGGLDNVLLDTSRLTTIIPNYNNVKKISFSRNSYANIPPAKVENNKIVLVDKISFKQWSNLESFDGANLDTRHIKDMSYMFSECKKLRETSFWGWNTENVTNMQQMFFGCSSIEKLDISNFSTPRLGAMEFMFAGCGASIIRMDNFSMSSVYSKYGIFDNTPQGKELLITTRDTQLLNYNYQGRIPFKTPKLNANGGQFADNSLEKSYFVKCAVKPEVLNMDEFNRFQQNNIPVNTGFGNNFVGWEKINGSSSNPSSVLDLLDSTYIAKWENPNWVFEENSSRILLKQYKGQSNEVVVPSEHNGKKIILQDINSNVIPQRITKFSIQNVNENKVGIENSDLNNAFSGNNNLREVDLRGLDLSNIQQMQNMFINCSSLTTVNLSNANLSNVTNMSSMFKNCELLSKVDFSNVKSTAVTSTQEMFFECLNLKVIDLTSLSLKNVTNDSGMFTTSAEKELLFLTNDSKFYDMDYKKRFRRVPINGPKFVGNGGVFEGNVTEKKYFDKCAYPKEKIQLTELEQFKNINKPVRKEFATTFVSWIPQSSVPSDAGTVLDLGNIIYKATWSDPNWDFTETDDEITLTRYKGTSNEIDLPAILDNKQVTLKDINNSIIPTTVTKFILKEKNGRKVKVQDTNLSQGFLNNSNLTEVNLSGLDSSSVTNLEELFKNCSNLLTVTLTGMNTQNVSNFKSMFSECTKLSNVNVSNLNTESVTDMSYLFYNCYALKDINLDGWNTTKVQWMGRMFHNTPVSSLDISHFSTPVLESTNRMFNGCNNLKLVRMDNFNMSSVNDSAAMFYRGGGTETLVVTNDQYLLNTHNFTQDNTYPLSKPVLNANGGKFDNQQNTKKYFDNCAVTPEKLQLAQFDQFKNSNIPTKDNAVFRGWTESGTSKTDEGVLNLLDKTYTAIWKNMICNTSSDNKKIESTGQLGMVYLPKQFATNSTTLNDSGKQEILINKNDSFNIGVRDVTQSSDSWNMTGQLKWNDSSIPGAYIQLDANANSIKINQNDNVNPYDAGRDLVSANEEVMIGNAEQGHIKITSDSANTVLKANPEKTKDAIYDYNLGNVSLVIPDAGVVQDGNYSANLEWNLSNAPQ